LTSFKQNSVEKQKKTTTPLFTTKPDKSPPKDKVEKPLQPSKPAIHNLKDIVNVIKPAE